MRGFIWGKMPSKCARERFRKRVEAAQRRAARLIAQIQNSPGMVLPFDRADLERWRWGG